MAWRALVLAIIIPTAAEASGIVSGTVVHRDSLTPLHGAIVRIQGQSIGMTTGVDGSFILTDVPHGQHVVTASHVGYFKQSIVVVVTADSAAHAHFSLVPSVIPGTPIIVSATRAARTITPASFETLERLELKERYHTQDVPMMLAELPSSTSYSESGSGIGYSYLNLRGFDSRRIAVMINGIPQNDPEDHNVYWLDFPDLAASLEDVQVQRGAGSAFYGPPAIGGSVNLVTENFARDLSIKLQVGAGSYNTRRYAASVQSGLMDGRYAIHGRLAKIQSDGYRDRAWADFDSYFLGAVRYDDQMTTQFNVYGGPIADGLAYYGIPKEDAKDRSKRRANPILRDEEIENFSQPHYELFHEWRVDESLTLNNTVFAVFGDGFFDYDGSWAPYSYFRITPENGFAVTGDPDTLFLPGALIRATVSNKQYGWLPRLTLKHSQGEFIVGAEIRVHNSEHYGQIRWSQELPADVPQGYQYYFYRGAKQILSLYAQELYSLSDRTTLMVNIQYAFNRYRLHDEAYVGTDFTVPYHFLNPRIGVNHLFNESWSAYVSGAYTSREPRLKNLYDAAEASTPPSWGAVVPQFEVDATGNYDFSRPLVKPESLLDLELGAGYQSKHWNVAANVYWMEFTDEIVRSGQVDRFGQPITGNADRTRHIGVELTTRTELLDGLELVANTTFSRNRFVHHTDYSTGTPLTLDENPIAGFPDVLFNARLTYRANNFSASLSGRYVGRQYTDNFKDDVNTVDPYFVSDAWVGYVLSGLWTNADVEFKVYVNNIFDTLYAAYGEGPSFFVGAERNFFIHLSLSL